MHEWEIREAKQPGVTVAEIVAELKVTLTGAHSSTYPQMLAWAGARCSTM